MARSAWKKVLNSSKQIQIIGETIPQDFVNFSNNSKPPEVIVAGKSFSWMGRISETDMLRSSWIRPKVIMIVDNKEQVKLAFKKGADFSALKPFDPHELITWVRSLSDDAKRLCAEYRDRFTKVQSIQSQNEIYCELVSSVLQLLFHPDLVNPENTKKPTNVSLASRLVFRNQAREHEFWIDASETHKSKYVTIDISNGAVLPDNISALGKYLTDSHGFMGLIIGRIFQPDTLHASSIALFEKEKKVVLPLNDLQLQTMLEYKAGGVNPVFELEHLYQKLIADAEK